MEGSYDMTYYEILEFDPRTFLGRPGGPPKSTVMSVFVFSMMSVMMAVPDAP